MFFFPTGQYKCKAGVYSLRSCLTSQPQIVLDKPLTIIKVHYPGKNSSIAASIHTHGPHPPFLNKGEFIIIQNYISIVSRMLQTIVHYTEAMKQKYLPTEVG